MQRRGCALMYILLSGWDEELQRQRLWEFQCGEGRGMERKGGGGVKNLCRAEMTGGTV